MPSKEPTAASRRSSNPWAEPLEAPGPKWTRFAAFFTVRGFSTTAGTLRLMLQAMSERRRLKNGAEPVDKAGLGSGSRRVTDVEAAAADMTARVETLGLKIEHARVEADLRAHGIVVPVPGSSRRPTMVVGGVLGLAMAGMAGGAALAASPGGHGGLPASQPEVVQPASSATPAPAVSGPAPGGPDPAVEPISFARTYSLPVAPVADLTSAPTGVVSGPVASGRQSGATAFLAGSFVPTARRVVPAIPAVGVARPGLIASPASPGKKPTVPGNQPATSSPVALPAVNLPGVAPVAGPTKPAGPTITVTKPATTPTWTAPTWKTPQVTAPTHKHTTWTSPQWKPPAKKYTAQPHKAGNKHG